MISHLKYSFKDLPMPRLSEVIGYDSVLVCPSEICINLFAMILFRDFGAI